MQLIVLSMRGAAPALPLSASFGAAGGTIGRSATNTLVLDDPDRTVSRVHAQLVCRSGRFFAVDRGSNPMQHNGRPIGTGNEVALADGDRLTVGSFELEVRMVDGATRTDISDDTCGAVGRGAGAGSSASLPADDDPFADLLAGLGSPAAAASPAPASRSPSPSPLSPSLPVLSDDSLLFPDPLGGAGGTGSAARGAASASDPFADLFGTPPPASGAAAKPALAADDFSDLGLAAGNAGTGIDHLFGDLGLPGGDPLALSPLADPLAQPNTASSDDPFAALQAAPRASEPARSDHLPMGQFGYVPPSVQPVLQATPPASPSPTPSPCPQPAPSTATATAPAIPPGPRATDDVLLSAFLRGLDSGNAPPAQLTPELMERIGTTLRAATEGTLQLLVARQALKREVRAEVTMIASQANNPLKFSPTVDVALAHLLGPGVRGFMAPEQAMRDAYDDLRAHQFGVMVGMRAALAHVIARFEPGELEKKISAKSALDSLFAANRKAKLWDQFVALYGGIATEAEDDFHSLFGKAFNAAYEEQMARFDAERPARHSGAPER